MKQLEPHHDYVGRFYDQIDEGVRLEAEDPIEYAITLRYLQRYISDNVTVADVGGCGGQYSELLARRGCRPSACSRLGHSDRQHAAYLCDRSVASARCCIGI